MPAAGVFMARSDPGLCYGFGMVIRFPEFSREMRRGEEAAVDVLLQRAFGGEDEARLVHALRKSGAVAGEVVLPFQGGVVGYYALSHMRAPNGWLCLAPGRHRP
jgi:putative acetyltransferase